MLRRVMFVIGGTALFLLALTPLSAQWGRTPAVSTSADRQNVVDIEFLGEVTFPTGYDFEGSTVGGLSGLAYDAEENVYYALSDGHSDTNPARYYELTIDIADGNFEPGDVQFTEVVTLLTPAGTIFPPLTIDPEAIALVGDGTIFVSSEGDVSGNLPEPVNPFINQFQLTGQQVATLTIPSHYLPGASTGIRHNLAFESLTITPNGRYLFSATENALRQDGPSANLEQQSLSRLLQYDLATGEVVGEFVYVVDPVSYTPVPTDGFRVNGLTDLLALDNNGTFLALEREFSAGVGHHVKLYEVGTQGALDVHTVDNLLWEAGGNVPFEIDPAVSKKLLLDFTTILTTTDNLEGLAFGPLLPDGRQSLIVMSDNNFNEQQFTQFLAFAVTLETTPAALPGLETPYTLNSADVPTGTLAGDSDDPAIWVHPSNPAASRVIATLKEGGLVVFDMDGQLVQQFAPAVFGEVRYNNVDLIYGFPIGDSLVDLAVVSDRIADSLAVFRINSTTGELTDITSPNMPNTIFGVDDEDFTAYGLAAFTHWETGRAYVFVSQAGGNQVAQLELTDDGTGRITAAEVRMLTLPVPTGDPEDSQAEGMVVDRELNHLYLAMENVEGILKFSALADGGNTYTLTHPITGSTFLAPDIEGLTIYYGPNGSGYLLVSSQGLDSYAVLDRAGDNDYLGSFIIGDLLGVDQANESDGADVLNVNLGPNFPNGLLVVQDGANDPQNPVEDDEQLENNSTNFKFVPWDNVSMAFEQPLMIDPDSYYPRPMLKQYLPVIVRP